MTGYGPLDSRGCAYDFPYYELRWLICMSHLARILVQGMFPRNSPRPLAKPTISALDVSTGSCECVRMGEITAPGPASLTFFYSLL